MTASSFVTCQECGAPVKLMVDRGQVHNPVAQGSFFTLSPVENLASICQETDTAKVKQNHGAVTPAQAAQEDPAVAHNDATEEKKEFANAEDKEAEHDQPEAVTITYKCDKCDKKSCPHRADKSKTSTSVNNNSTALRNNYAKATGVHGALTETDSSGAPLLKDTKAHRVYTDSEEKAKEIDDPASLWRYAAHHLISGDQVFSKLPELVTIANQCGYDINNARNCVILPTNYDAKPLALRQAADSEDDTVETGNRVSAWDAMSLSRMQWHGSHHVYMKSLNTLNDIDLIKSRIKFFTKKEPARELKDYAALLFEEMEKVRSYFNNRPVCGAAFVSRLDNICAKIRAKLADFADGYHKSYPWYVSREAFSFAFELPTTFKIIVARDEHGQLRMEKYRLSRKQQGPVTVNLKESVTLAQPVSHDDAIKCILFCSNVLHFVFLGNATSACLPFSIDARHVYSVTSGGMLGDSAAAEGSAHIEKHASEYLLWAQQTSDDGYVAPLEMIRKRQREYSQQSGGGAAK